MLQRGAEVVGEAVTPSFVDVDLRDLPRAPDWQPGDPIKEIPRRSRTAAALSFAEVTIAVDGGQNVSAAHEIADAVEDKLRDDLGFNHVQVHVEPC